MNNVASHRRRTEEVLKDRARLLARAGAPSRQDAPSITVIEFRLANERYAIEQPYVCEVHPLRDICPFPCAPPFVLGIINVRGQVLPVLDIRRFFDLPEAGIVDIHQVIVVQANKETDERVGVLADVVTGVRRILVDSIQSSLPTLTGIRAQYLKGVTSDHVTILDVSKIVADPKLVVNEEVDSGN